MKIDNIFWDFYAEFKKGNKEVFIKIGIKKKAVTSSQYKAIAFKNCVGLLFTTI